MPLRECDDFFGGPADHVTENWRGADHVVIGNDQAGNEVRPDDPYLLGLGIHWLMAAGRGSPGGRGFGGRGGFGFCAIVASS